MDKAAKFRNIFDTHAHYEDAAFDSDREALLESLPKAGVCAVISCGTDFLSSCRSLELAEKYPYIYAALGFHPENLADERIGDFERIEEMLACKKAAAVGETGLDYHYDDAVPKDTQRKAFIRHILLAKRLGLPVIVHDRDAHADVLSIIKEYRPSGVVHCFSGSAESALQLTELGMYIGLGGVCTFKNARRALEVAAAIPQDRLLLETDAPYLAPEPERGHRNDSSLIPYTAAVIAKIRGLDTQELIDAACENARRLFNIY